MNHPVVVLVGPHRAAALCEDFEIARFPVGIEGCDEGAMARLLRLVVSPLFLAAAIVLRHASIVHINTALDTRVYWRDLAYLAVAKMLGRRVVYQVHGGALPQRFFAGSSALTAFLRWTLRVPDLVVVLAQCELKAYRDFVPGQHVVALPNGIDWRPYGSVPTVRSLPDHPLHLVYMGRVAREKGLYETLQGLRLAHELGVDARLVIAGRGPEELRLRRYAQALGVAGRVCFVGPVFGADRLKLLSGADIMIIPSYSEGLPYVLLEGMAAGIPVIATPVGAIPDVVADGTHGFLVPPRDGKAIAESLAVLAGDRERLSWMSRACRRRIRAAFSIDRLARELATHYAQVCGGVADGGRLETMTPRVASRRRQLHPVKSGP